MSFRVNASALPEDFRRALRQSGLLGFFTDCAYVHRTGYLGWIAASARPETRRRRIRQSVMRLLQQRAEVEAAAMSAAAGASSAVAHARGRTTTAGLSRRCA